MRTRRLSRGVGGAAWLLAGLVACAGAGDGSHLITSVSPNGVTTGDQAVNTTGGRSGDANDTGSTGSTGGSSTGTTTGGVPPGYVPPGPPQVFATARGMAVMTADTNLCIELQPDFSVALAVCDGGDAQRWELSQGALRSVGGGTCLDISGATAADNVPLVATTCAAVNAKHSQQWNFSQGTLLASSTDVSSAPTSNCVAVAGAAGQGAGLVVHTRLRTCQHFVLGFDGALVSLDGSNNRCIASSNGALRTDACLDSNPAQLWTLSGAGELRIAGSNTCVDLSGGKLAEGTAAILADCNGGVTQSWTWNAADSSLRPYAASTTGNPTVLVASSLFGTLSITQKQPHGIPYTVSK